MIPAFFNLRIRYIDIDYDFEVKKLSHLFNILKSNWL